MSSLLTPNAPKPSAMLLVIPENKNNQRDGRQLFLGVFDNPFFSPLSYIWNNCKIRASRTKVTNDSALFGTSSSIANCFYSKYTNRTMHEKLCETLHWVKIRDHDVKSGTLTFCDNFLATLGFTQKDLRSLADHAQNFHNKYRFKSLVQNFQNANRRINLTWNQLVHNLPVTIPN